MLENLRCFVLSEEFPLGEFVKQLATLAVLHHDVVPPVVVKRFVNSNDVRVVKVLENFSFLHHALFENACELGVFAENFDRALDAVLSVKTDSDFAEASGAEQFAELVEFVEAALVRSDEHAGLHDELRGFLDFLNRHVTDADTRTPHLN